jgi:lipid-A-disaccharide synthase-like uncharacterized protein
MLAKLAAWWATVSTVDLVWLGIGLAGQTMFSARWIIQWLASERVRRAIVPEMFWYCSLFGGLMVLAYGLWKLEPVIILGQFGVLIYARNIYFIWKEKLAGEPAPESVRKVPAE